MAELLAALSPAPPAEEPEAPAPSVRLGEACASDADCAFEVEGTPAECHVAGFCTVPCEGLCPQLEGRAATFCAADPSEDGEVGICVPLAVPENGHCADLPATIDAWTTRFMGASDAPDAEAEVCLPATLDAFGDESAETPFE